MVEEALVAADVRCLWRHESHKGLWGMPDYRRCEMHVGRVGWQYGAVSAGLPFGLMLWVLKMEMHSYAMQSQT